MSTIVIFGGGKCPREEVMHISEASPTDRRRRVQSGVPAIRPCARSRRAV